LLQVHEAAVVAGDPTVTPGAIMATSAELVVACGENALRLIRVQAAGGKPLSAEQYLAGRRVVEPVLGRSGAPAPQPPLIVPVVLGEES
jgi:methionyl-tRNA formyltransferase